MVRTGTVFPNPVRRELTSLLHVFEDDGNFGDDARSDGKAINSTEILVSHSTHIASIAIYMYYYESCSCSSCCH